MTPRTRHQRGTILMLAGIWLVAMSAIAAIAIGVSRLTDTATEVQTVADAGALAGASALLRSQDAYTAARNVAQVNRIDGKAGNFDAGLPTPNCDTNNADSCSPNGTIVSGYFDPTSHQLVVGGTHPDDAVKATEYTRVTSLWASTLTPGNLTAPVTKQALAGYSALTSNRDSRLPTLPVAIGDCRFSGFQQGADCSQLPLNLTQIPNTANTGWTSLTPSQGNTGNTEPYLPAQCGVRLSGGQGGIQPAPDVTTGENVGVIGGQTDPLINDICQCATNGLTEWVIPIVKCDPNGNNFNNLNQAMTVVGFASIRITAVCSQTNHPPCFGDQTINCTGKYINLDTFCSYPGIGGPPTQDNFGSGKVALLQ